MAYAMRGRRVAYDNIAVGSVSGPENVIAGVSWVSLVSFQTNPLDAAGFSNISNASLPGIEDNTDAEADKFTSDSEDISDGG